jgi:hypothetical protein
MVEASAAVLEAATTASRASGVGKADSRHSRCNQLVASSKQVRWEGIDVGAAARIASKDLTFRTRTLLPIAQSLFDAKF